MSDVAKNIKEAGMESGISTDDTTRIYERKTTNVRSRKKYIIITIVAICIVVAGIISEGTLRPYLERMRSLTFDPFTLMLYDYTVRPICSLALGVFIVSFLSIWADTRLEKRIRIIVLIVGFVLILPSLWMLAEVLSLILWEREFFGFSLIFFSLLLPQIITQYLPILAGSALFIGFNKKKTKV